MANQVVETYYHGNGNPDLSTTAFNYANQNFPGAHRDAALEGCLDAFNAEYKRVAG